MKKVIAFLGVVVVALTLSACQLTTKSKKFSIAELNKEFVPYYENDPFTYVELPDTAEADAKRTARKLPVSEKDAQEDVDYILQAFYYENGASRREEILGKTDVELLEELIDELFDYFDESYGISVNQKQTVKLDGKTYNFRDEVSKRILATIRSLQTANQYEITNLQVKDNKVVVNVELRSIDTYQYTVMLANSPKYVSTYSPFAIKSQTFDKNDPEEHATYKLYETVLMNTAVYELNKDHNYTVPLEHPARTYSMEFTFEYDKNGYLTIPKKTLLQMTQVRVEKPDEE